MLYYLWGILASITGIVVLCNAVRKRKSIGAVLYGTYCSFSLVCIVAGIICMICQQYDELCAFLFGIAFLVMTYRSRHDFPPSFSIDYINYLKGYFVGFGSILYAFVKTFLEEWSMKQILFISLSAIFLLILLFACTGKQTTSNYRVEKTWAKNQEQSSKVHVLKKNAQFANGKRVLYKGQKYIEMTENDMKEVDLLVEKYLYRNICWENVGRGSNGLSCYFRQYLCYEENRQTFVFVNLYAYRTTKYDTKTTNAFADYPSEVVINPLKGNTKDYKILLVNLSEKTINSCRY